MTVSIQQTVVHAPGVDTEGIQLPVAALLEGQQTGFQLIEQVGSIPVEYAVHFHIVVFEAVKLLHGDLLAVELTQDRPAVAGAQVKCQIIFHAMSLLSKCVTAQRRDPGSDRAVQQCSYGPSRTPVPTKYIIRLYFSFAIGKQGKPAPPKWCRSVSAVSYLVIKPEISPCRRRSCPSARRCSPWCTKHRRCRRP